MVYDIPENEVFTFTSPRKGNGECAKGHFDDLGFFVVHKGSIVCQPMALSMKPAYKKLRLKLEQDRVIDKDKNGDLRFTRNSVFKNPSEAASVIEGGTRSGTESCWKDAVGKSLSDRGCSR